MNLSLAGILLILSALSTAISDITFYTGEECTGNYFGFVNKEPNLDAWKSSLRDVKSIRLKGVWAFYRDTNFENAMGLGFDGACHPFPDKFDSPVKSLRYLGPPDASTPAIAMYPKHIFAGEEVIVTGHAANNFKIIPRNGLIFGNSSWMAWTNNDFTGTSTCLVSTDQVADFDFEDDNTLTFASLVRGCDTRRADKVMYPKRMDFHMNMKPPI